MIAPDPGGVPAHLTETAHWVLWRTETRINRNTGETETTKPPISYHTSKKCDVTDPRTWTGFAEVAGALDKSRAWDGFGFVLGPVVEHEEQVIGLDADECLDEEGALADWAKPFLTAFGSYTEHSPGGRGLKCIARIRAADMPMVRQLLDIAAGDREQARTVIYGEKTAGRHAPGVQFFLGRRYFTITGRHWTPSPEDVTVLTVGQVAQIATLFGPRKKTSDTPTGQRDGDDATEPDEAALNDQLGAAFVRNPRLRERWEGGTAGLNDTSRSGFDMSITALLIAEGFAKGETLAALCRFQHGKVDEEDPRYFERMWQRSTASPRGDREPPDDWEEQHPPHDGEDASQSTPGYGNQTAMTRRGRIHPGDDFMTGFTPPDWLIEGIVQRGRLYACTSLTGHGKTAVWLFIACMIHAGSMVGHLDGAKGNVLILAGENPEDLKARMHGMAAYHKLKPGQFPYVLPATFPMTDEEVDALIAEIVGLGIPFSLIVGDTASSFFPGDDENDNVQAGAYARTLRRLTLEVPGNPTVVALCHPVKSAQKGNLLPRGGGAFLNELDGNLTLWSESQGEVTELHWQGKIRGPDFVPLSFRLRPVPTGFADRKDRDVMTIVAEPMSEEAATEHKKLTLANTDVVLRMLKEHPEWSHAQMAREAGWVDEDDQPLRGRVQRAFNSLAKDKLIEKKRDNAPWTLTSNGEVVAKGGNP
jgi:hypothetical protein